MPFFNATYLPPALPEYVVWIDIMGTQAVMSRSTDITANFIFKLHVAAINAHTQHPNVLVYPVMDGLYASSQSQEAILNFICSIFTDMADGFNQEKNPYHRFLIRGSLAFGPVIHGKDIGAKASKELDENKNYRDAILLGMPMVQAYLSERNAPPFGIFVHESARAFAPTASKPIHYIWWKWQSKSSTTWNSLETSLLEHLDWCSERCMQFGYPADRINAHKEMVKQYFIF